MAVYDHMLLRVTDSLMITQPSSMLAQADRCPVGLEAQECLLLLSRRRSTCPIWQEH